MSPLGDKVEWEWMVTCMHTLMCAETTSGETRNWSPLTLVRKRKFIVLSFGAFVGVFYFIEV